MRRSLSNDSKVKAGRPGAGLLEPLRMAHRVAYLLLISFFLSGRLRLFSGMGALFFGVLWAIQWLKMRELTFPSSLPVFIACLAMEAARSVMADVDYYQGTFFYGSFGSVFLASLLLQKPYTLNYFGRRQAAAVENNPAAPSYSAIHNTFWGKYHRNITLVWCWLFGLNSYLSLILIPDFSYIWLPLGITIAGVGLLNYALPQIIVNYGLKEAPAGAGHSQSISIENGFLEMAKFFKAELIAGWKMIVEYHVKEGFRTEVWHLIIADGTCRFEKGKHPKPDLKLIADAKTWRLIIQGALTGEQAFFKNKMKVDGNMETLILYNELFKQSSFG